MFGLQPQKPAPPPAQPSPIEHVLATLSVINAMIRQALVPSGLEQLERGAKKFGEQQGTQWERQRAQAGYAKAHPESLRAKQEQMNNAVMMALGMVNPAGKTKLLPLTERTVENHAAVLREIGKPAHAANLENFMSGSVVRKPVFRGDFDVDAMGATFKKGKATSGRFYFTDDPHIAGGDPTLTAAEGKIRGYAGKYDPEAGSKDFGEWFRVGTGKKTQSLDRAWYDLTPEQKQRVKETFQQVTQDDEGNFVREPGNKRGNGGIWEGSEREHHGNWLTIGKDAWLNSGSLYDDEQRFSELLNMAGIPHRFKNPQVGQPGVTPVYLNIKRPIVAENPPADYLAALDQAAKHDRSRAKFSGGGPWDKEGLSFREWYENRFKYSLSDKDAAARGTWATVIPDKAVEIARKLGYDGIQHIGGITTGGKQHHVYIAFEPNQIKSAIGNKGGFDPTKASILAGGAGVAVGLKANADKEKEKKMAFLNAVMGQK